MRHLFPTCSHEPVQKLKNYNELAHICIYIYIYEPSFSKEYPKGLLEVELSTCGTCCRQLLSGENFFLPISVPIFLSLPLLSPTQCVLLPLHMYRHQYIHDCKDVTHVHVTLIPLHKSTHTHTRYTLGLHMYKNFIHFYIDRTAATYVLDLSGE